MSAGSEHPSANRVAADDRLVGGVARRSQNVRPRLTSSRSSTEGISAALRRVFGEAAARASVALAETAGRLPDEIEIQLHAVLASLPELGSHPDGEFSDYSGTDIPHRY